MPRLNELDIPWHLVPSLKVAGHDHGIHVEGKAEIPAGAKVTILTVRPEKWAALVIERFRVVPATLDAGRFVKVISSDYPASNIVVTERTANVGYIAVPQNLVIEREKTFTVTAENTSGAVQVISWSADMYVSRVSDD